MEVSLLCDFNSYLIEFVILHVNNFDINFLSRTQFCCLMTFILITI